MARSYRGKLRKLKKRDELRLRKIRSLRGQLSFLPIDASSNKKEVNE